MKTRSLHWTIETVVRRKLRINPQPQYQRTPVWSEAKRQLLIDSILRQYDMPKFYLRESNPPYDHEVVDGQQRLRAIWDFYEGRYVLGDTSKDIPDFGDLSGKKFSELPSDTQDRIGLFDLNLVEVEDASDLEIRDLFLRLQEGVALNPVEKRNAMPGNMRNFIADLGENQRVFPLTSISEKRFEWHDLTAIVHAWRWRKDQQMLRPIVSGKCTVTIRTLAAADLLRKKLNVIWHTWQKFLKIARLKWVLSGASWTCTY